ncbi:MAG TPA: hypothetical protein PLT66_09060, partial [Bacillota bacterium]|nr:hypothetical protein [Bacillota bacterium]
MKPVLALQIYSVRDAYANDKRSTLQKTKAMGYDAVELFGAMDTPAEQIREMLDSCGLKVAGYHTAWSWLDDEHFDATVEYNKAIGNDKIIIPWIDDCMKNSQQAWEKTNELFSAMSEKLATVRMRFGFHSHACEHTLLDGGSYGWKLFCDGTPD